ncbi:MAG: DUF2062 domain-containing protein [Stappiaceae bacterium]
MLFQRRTRPSWLHRLRVALWPKSGFKRSYKYFGKRVLRLTASEHAVAAGVAAGAMASFTPFVGFHFIIAFFFAFFVGGNMLAAALGTSVGNPLTFPFMWTANFKVGSLILDGKVAKGAHKTVMIEFDRNVVHAKSIGSGMRGLWEILTGDIGWPLLVGSIPNGLIAALLIYVITRYAVRIYQNGRRRRLEARRLIQNGRERLSLAKNKTEKTQSSPHMGENNE